MNNDFIILQDVKEKRPFLFPGKSLHIQKVKLPVGDYSLLGYEHSISVEKKSSPLEIQKNIGQSRFWNQLKKMSQYAQKLILCTFSQNQFFTWNAPGLKVGSGKNRKLIYYNANHVFSTFKAMADEYKIDVVYAESKSSAENYLLEFLTNAFHTENTKLIPF
jgi:ERCC4-type nuclease